VYSTLNSRPFGKRVEVVEDFLMLSGECGVLESTHPHTVQSPGPSSTILSNDAGTILAICKTCVQYISGFDVC